MTTKERLLNNSPWKSSGANRGGFSTVWPKPPGFLGIQPLLMAAARSALRQRMAMPGGLGRVVTDVNRLISEDVEESGQFLTMFIVRIDLAGRSLSWISAGHDPALVYDPASDSFGELQGRGPALGLIDDFQYEESRRDLPAGHIIIIATDGVWEAHNRHGQMFGKDRLNNIIRMSSRGSAQDIVDAVIQEVEDFSLPGSLEDDITLAAVKVR